MTERELQIKKLIAVNKEAGQFQTKNGQGTLYSIYDAITVEASPNVYKFFPGGSGRDFPDTNLPNGQIPQNEAMVAKAITFLIVEYTTGVISGISTLEALDPAFLQSELTIRLGNSTVMKKFCIAQSAPEFNPMSVNDTYTGIVLPGTLILPALSPLDIELRCPAGIAADANKKIKMIITGPGALEKLSNY